MKPNPLGDPQLHGSMEVSTQLRTYHTSMIGLRYVVLATVVSLSLLIAVFCLAVGWSGAIVIAFVELAIGLYFAKERNQRSWQSDVASLIITTEVESGQPTANHARAGIRRGTLSMWAITAVLATIAIGAVFALHPHLPGNLLAVPSATPSASGQTGR